MEIRNLDEDGFWTIKTQDISTNSQVAITTINSIPVSETPIFLVLNKAQASTPPNPVASVNVTPTCCTDFLVTWTPAVDHTNYASYSIYAAPAAGTTSALDIALATYVQTGISANATQYLVTNLKPNVPYVFWVIPVTSTGEIPNNLDNLAPAIANTGCNSCLYDVWNNSTHTLGSQVNISEANQLMANAQQCAYFNNDYDGSDNIDFWGYQANADNEANSMVQMTDILENGFGIDITNIYVLDLNGHGNLRVEYQTLGNPTWQHFGTFNMDDWNVWKTIAGSALTKKVTGLRFSQNDGFGMAKFLVCAKPADNFTGNGGGNQITQMPDGTKVSVTNITRRTANVQWTPMLYNRFQPQLGNVTEYTLVYKAVSNKNESIYQDYKTIIIPADRFGTSVSLPLDLLSPSTTYIGKLVNGRPDIEKFKKESALNWTVESMLSKIEYRSAVFQFTTLDLPDAITKASEQNATGGTASLIKVYPNPLMPENSDCSLIFPTDGYYFLEVLNNATGKLVLSMPLDATQKECSFSMRKAEAGNYSIRCYDRRNEVETVQLIIVKN